ncbi:hypothetical protein KTQ42_13605|uniref:hypothetical protein n=1 Tax=Noviherbaspirillum sp. L7-7A TaxID=2850560 RepID=UPI001C2C2EC8|nr:hypothetical protein [Noviherbaspirillum sp. L7-7A]
MTKDLNDLPLPTRKATAPRQKKVLVTLSPTVASPEVMLPEVALEQAAAPLAAAPAAEKKKDKPKAKKQKLVRDSFTMPEAEYEALAEMKKTCIKAGVAVKKSELLRVAVSLLRKMDVAQIEQALGTLTPVKAGRPSKQK